MVTNQYDVANTFNSYFHTVFVNDGDSIDGDVFDETSTSCMEGLAFTEAVKK